MLSFWAWDIGREQMPKSVCWQHADIRSGFPRMSIRSFSHTSKNTAKSQMKPADVLSSLWEMFHALSCSPAALHPAGMYGAMKFQAIYRSSSPKIISNKIEEEPHDKIQIRQESRCVAACHDVNALHVAYRICGAAEQLSRPGGTLDAGIRAHE